MKSWLRRGRDAESMGTPRLFGAPIERCPTQTFASLVLGEIVAGGGLAMEGIFRVPGAALRIGAAESLFEAGEVDDPRDPKLAALGLSAHDWASLFTRWLRQLPVPLVPPQLYEAAVEIGRAGMHASIDELNSLFRALPNAHRAVVMELLRFVRAVDPVTSKMSKDNFAVVFAPSLLRHPDLATAAKNAAFEANFAKILFEKLEIPSQDAASSDADQGRSNDQATEFGAKQLRKSSVQWEAHTNIDAARTSPPANSTKGADAWTALVKHSYKPLAGERDRLEVMVGEWLVVPYPSVSTEDWVFLQQKEPRTVDRPSSDKKSESFGWVPRNHVSLLAPGPGAE
eukprot:SAG31_NODE_959_length_10757_cov_2.260086_7_plen_342_part_00